MNAKDLIRLSLESSRNWLTMLALDLKDSPTATAGGLPAHPVWILGHAVDGEMGMVCGWILGEEPARPEWKPLFGQGSQPVADASAYPSIPELAAEWEKVRARTLQVLGSMSEADFDKPSKAPAGLAHIFGTVGQCFTMLSLHTAFHAGQIADIRKFLGRPPIFG